MKIDCPACKNPVRLHNGRVSPHIMDTVAYGDKNGNKAVFNLKIPCPTSNVIYITIEEEGKPPQAVKSVEIQKGTTQTKTTDQTSTEHTDKATRLKARGMCGETSPDGQRFCTKPADTTHPHEW